MSNDQLFLKLSLLDIRNNLRELISSESSLKLWKSDKIAISVRMSDFKEDAISIFEVDELDENEEYFISFSHRGMSYFFKGIRDKDKLKISSDIFRSEKRKDLRLLVYPIIKGYIYFKVDSSNHIQNNVISFNRFKSNETELFKDFSKEVGESPELSGERIIDISKRGLSFICTASEYEVLKDNWPEDALLILDGEKVSIQDMSIRYDVDYLDSRMESITMKKIGIEFQEDTKVDEFVEKLNDNSIILTSIDEEFQKYITTEE